MSSRISPVTLLVLIIISLIVGVALLSTSFTSARTASFRRIRVEAFWSPPRTDRNKHSQQQQQQKPTKLFRALAIGSEIKIFDISDDKKNTEYHATLFATVDESDSTELNALAFDATGERAAVGGDDGKIVMFEPETGRWLKSTRDPGAPVYALDFSPLPHSFKRGGAEGESEASRKRRQARGGRLFSAGESGMIQTYISNPPNLQRDENAKAMREGKSRIRSLAACSYITPSSSHEGKEEEHILLAHGMNEPAEVVVWNFSRVLLQQDNNKEPKPMRKFGKHKKAVKAVLWNKDCTQVVSAAFDGTMRIWNVATGEEIKPELGIHKVPVTAMASSRDGNYFASGGFDGKVYLWFHRPDGTKSIVLPTIDVKVEGASVNSLSYSKDDQVLAVTIVHSTSKKNFDNSIYFFSLKAQGFKQIGRPFNNFHPITKRVDAGLFSSSPTSSVFASIDESGKVNLADITFGEFIKKIDAQNPVASLEFLDDAKKLRATLTNNQVKIFDLSLNRQNSEATSDL